MVVHDRGYARWDGDREQSVPGIRVILDRGVTTALNALFRRKLFAQVLSFVAFGPFLFGLIFLYVFFYFSANEQFAELADDIRRSGMLDTVQPSPDTAWGFLYEIQLPVMLILCGLVGSGLVAEDRRTNALELYLSRPLSVAQYVLGKLLIVAFFLALVTIAPACLLILEQMMLSAVPEQRGALLDLLWRTVLAGGLQVGMASLLVLAASSLARRARNAAILWIGFLLVLELVVANILQEIFREPNLRLVSLHHAVGQCMAGILGNEIELDGQVPLARFAVVVGGWAVLCLAVVLRRVRPVEIVA